jgi:hypothetical protein
MAFVAAPNFPTFTSGSMPTFFFQNQNVFPGAQDRQNAGMVLLHAGMKKDYPREFGLIHPAFRILKFLRKPEKQRKNPDE